MLSDEEILSIIPKNKIFVVYFIVIFLILLFIQLSAIVFENSYKLII